MLYQQLKSFLYFLFINQLAYYELLLVQLKIEITFLYKHAHMLLLNFIVGLSEKKL